VHVEDDRVWANADASRIGGEPRANDSGFAEALDKLALVGELGQHQCQLLSRAQFSAPFAGEEKEMPIVSGESDSVRFTVESQLHDAVLAEGAIELAEEVFHMPVRLGVPQYVTGLVDVVSNPIHATGVGLLLYAKSNLEQQRTAPPLLSGSVQSIFERMKNWFQGNF